MKKKRERDHIDDYIDAMREPTDGCLTSWEQVKYNIMSGKQYKDPDTNSLTQLSTLERMIAYERFLINECRWRYPSPKSQKLNTKDADKEFKEWCKFAKQTEKKLRKKKK
jgi:hypothetical protein